MEYKYVRKQTYIRIFLSKLFKEVNETMKFMSVCGSKERKNFAKDFLKTKNNFQVLQINKIKKQIVVIVLTD